MNVCKPQWITRVSLTSALVIATSLATACGNRDNSAGALSTTVDSSGVSVVTGRATDVALPWTFTELYRLGGADSGVTSFTRANISNVSTNGTDRIAVLDPDNNNTIQLFDSSGTWIRSLGATGSGPGEMQFPRDVRLTADGRLMVYDIMKQALLQWDATGEILPEHRLVHSGSVSTVVPVGNGELYVGVFTTDTVARVSRLEQWTTSDTVVIDSLVGPRPKMVQFSCVGLSLPPLFTGELAWAAGAGSVAITTQSSYVIDIRDRGKLVRSIRRNIPPIAAVADDAAKLYPDGLKVVFEGGGCVTPSKEIGEKLGVAPTLPVVRRLVFDPVGRLWVERYTFEDETPKVDVFDADGRYEGTVTGRSLPLGFLGTDRVLFPIEDATTGVTVVGVFRVGHQ